MAESVELCIQISAPTTPRHHRDEELPVANVRICRTVCTYQQLVNSSNIENLRIYRTVDTNRPRVSESIKLLIKIDRGCVAVRIRETLKRGSESIELLAQIDTVVRKCETVAKLSWV